jgi:ribosomal-protein-alanine N-acetyltransferase
VHLEPELCSGWSRHLLGPEHLQACLQLDQAALDGLWTSAQWQRELEDPRRPCLGLVASDQLLALASGWLVVDELHITAVAVDPQRRRQGLGRQVLQGLLEHAAAAGAEHATLEVAASNGAALALYASCGFRNAGIRRAYYRNGDDALIQWMHLRHADLVRIAAHS